jgi:hypothetical protein|tara:strand:+ start:78 stop:377 length:300 start_codon:yes stop_codon:yes gene_type:complete
MIRTFRDTSEELAFPLFSHAKTTLDPSGLDFLTLQNGLWDDVTIPFIDTNLNAPHTTSTGDLQYPILDPRLFGEDPVEGLEIVEHPTSDLDEELPMLVS